MSNSVNLGQIKPNPYLEEMKTNEIIPVNDLNVIQVASQTFQSQNLNQQLDWIGAKIENQGIRNFLHDFTNPPEHNRFYRPREKDGTTSNTTYEHPFRSLLHWHALMKKAITSELGVLYRAQVTGYDVNDPIHGPMCTITYMKSRTQSEWDLEQWYDQRNISKQDRKPLELSDSPNDEFNAYDRTRKFLYPTAFAKEMLALRAKQEKHWRYAVGVLEESGLFERVIYMKGEEGVGEPRNWPIEEVIREDGILCIYRKAPGHEQGAYIEPPEMNSFEQETKSDISAEEEVSNQGWTAWLGEQISVKSGWRAYCESKPIAGAVLPKKINTDTPVENKNLFSRISEGFLLSTGGSKTVSQHSVDSFNTCETAVDAPLP